jgi:hypothetical protein
MTAKTIKKAIVIMVTLMLLVTEVAGISREQDNENRQRKGGDR